MNEITNLLLYLLTHQGWWAATIFIILGLFPLVSLAYLVFSESALGKILDKKFTEKTQSEKELHLQGNKLRKEFHRNIGRVLEGLAVETESNRALTFEFSNGGSNLVGLPFLYMSLAAEVMSPDLAPMIQRNQRINISIVSAFLLELEDKGYIYIPDFAQTREDFKIISHFVGTDIKSGLFYSLEGIDQTVGFIAIITTNKSNKTIDQIPATAEITKAAQKISALINFSELAERTEFRRGEKKHKWWIW